LRLKIDSNIRVANRFEPPIEVEFDGEDVTAGQLLKYLDDKMEFIAFSKRGEMGEDVKHVHINGDDLFRMPRGLSTPLKDGDRVRVDIFMEPLAGG
jgi:hypothetical protein